MRERMTDQDFYKLNQCHGDAKKSHDLAEEYFKEGLELQATIKSQREEITHLQQRLARAHEMLGV